MEKGRNEFLSLLDNEKNKLLELKNIIKEKGQVKRKIIKIKQQLDELNTILSTIEDNILKKEEKPSSTYICREY
ncbi:hypothetical protein [Clostridium cochlearium]|uniref:hypothetical protein n=1 Tax=Clostridium cochlearium TaxID=1494 RepID=UPI000BBB8FAB|nr:hypothetical protein [Clostridium cochlearium]